MYNVLAIGAHPDDIEFGCAGTLAKLKQLDCKIIYLLMTNGENWEKKNGIIRVHEQESACKKLGIEHMYWFKIEDGKVRTDANLIDKIENIIIENKIDMVFSNHPNDSHQDHRELSNIVKSGCRFCDNIFYYETISSIGFEANMYVDITEEYALKNEILKSFESQIQKYHRRKLDFIKLVQLKNSLHGLKSACEYAEGFYIEKFKFDSFVRNSMSGFNDLSDCAVTLDK